MAGKPRRITPDKLRSRLWFDNPDNPGHDRALSRALHELRPDAARSCSRASRSSASPRPAPTSSPCNRHHLELAKRVREGIRDGRRHRLRVPGAPDPGDRQAADRLRSTATSPISALVEVLYGYPLDGVVLTTGCDKTTPALLMAAATVNIPAIVALRSGRCSTAGSAASAPAPAPSCGRRASCSPPARSTTSSSSTSSPPRRPRSATATPWARPRR